jgi:hypothetical protein
MYIHEPRECVRGPLWPKKRALSHTECWMIDIRYLTLGCAYAHHSLQRYRVQIDVQACWGLAGANQISVHVVKTRDVEHKSVHYTIYTCIRAFQALIWKHHLLEHQAYKTPPCDYEFVARKAQDYGNLGPRRRKGMILNRFYRTAAAASSACGPASKQWSRGMIIILPINIIVLPKS